MEKTETEYHNPFSAESDPGLPVFPISQKLYELSQRTNGWFLQETEVPPIEKFAVLDAKFRKHFAPTLPTPDISPARNGAVRVEWLNYPVHNSMEINLDTHSARWYWFHHLTDEDSEQIIDLNTDADWEWVCLQIAT